MNKRNFVKTVLASVSAILFAQSVSAQNKSTLSTMSGAGIGSKEPAGAGVIKLGQSVPLTGAAKDLGIEMRDGAMAYFKWVNANGGVGGKKIELITLDDQYEPEKAKANTENLIGQNVFALFGYVGTPTSVAARPLFEEAKIPFIAPFTGAESLRNPVSPLIFNLRASYFDETERIVEYITSFDMTKIGVFYQNDAYGQAGLAGVRRALEKRKLSIVGEGTVERNTTKVDEAVKKIAAQKPEAIIMISAYSSCAQFIKSYKATKNQTQFYNVSFVGSNSLANALGEDGHGVVISQVVPPPNDISIAIVDEFRKHMSEYNPKSAKTFTSLEGYIAAKMLVYALNKPGATNSREELVKSLNSIKQLDLGGFFVSFSEKDHSGSTFVDLTMIGRNKNFVY